jgi:hypothetical protein
MNSAQRAFKKLIIASIVLGVIGVIALIIFWPEKPKCENGILDEGEEQIDCGGFCANACPEPEKPSQVENIRINWTQLVEDGRNNYDFVASLSNPNTSWGVSKAKYIFTYLDEEGNELGSEDGFIYVMPRGDDSDESVKYLIEDNIKSTVPIAEVKLDLSDFKWEEVVGEYDTKNLNENVIDILDENLGLNTSVKVYAVTGKTENTSTYDFKEVNIHAVLFDESNKVLAAGSYPQLTIISGDGWGFEIKLPNVTDNISKVTKVDIRAETDVFDKNNFMKDYRATDKE